MKLLIGFSTILLSFNLAQASPYKYATCKNVSLNHPENSAGGYFNEKCDTFYVLPPEQGTVSVSSFSEQLTKTQCEIVQTEMEVIESLLDHAKEIVKMLADSEKQEYMLTVELDKKMRACSQIEDAVSEIKGMVSAINAQLDVFETQKATEAAALKACQESENGHCGSYERRIKSLDRQIEKLQKHIEKVSPQKALAVAQSEACIKSFEDKSTSIKERRDRVRADIASFRTDIDSMVKDYTDIIAEEETIKGATVGLTFKAGHNDIVESYKNANEELNGAVAFRAIPINSMKMIMTSVIDGTEAQTPIVLKSNIPGVSVGGSAQATLGQTTLNINPEVQKQLIMGAAISGSVVINRLSACNLAKGQNTDIEGLITANIIYEYDVTAKRSYRIDFRQTHLYSIIKRKSSKRGFFKSSSSASITEKATSREWIDIIISADDSRVDYDDRQQMIEDLKREKLDTALMKVTLGFFGEGNPAIPAMGKSGAEKASKTLKQCPNYYCQVAGFVLDLGSAFFGGGKVTSSHTKHADASQSELVKEEIPVKHVGSIGFKIEGRND